MLNYIKIEAHFSFGAKFCKFVILGQGHHFQLMFIISMFNLLWVLNFIRIRHIAILRPSLPKFLIWGQYLQFQISFIWLTNLTCSVCQISYHCEYILFFEPIFPGMRGLTLVLMLNVCYLAIILIILVVTWLLLIT